MAIKLPAPRNGWRVFAGEVGVIVLGVLIALGAQEVVEELRWRDEVRRTEDALTIEIAESVVHASERQMVNRCLGDRLGQLIRKVSAGDGPWKADPIPVGSGATTVETVVPAAYRTPNRPWSADVWAAAQNSGVFNHMSRERVAAFAKVYARMAGLRKVNELEQQVFPELLYLSFNTQLDASARQRALTTLGKLDWLNGTMLLDGKQLVAEAKAVGLDFSRTSLNAELAERERKQRAFRGACVRHFEVSL